MPIPNTKQPMLPLASTAATAPNSDQVSITTSSSSPLPAIPSSSGSSETTTDLPRATVADAPSTPLKHKTYSRGRKAAKARGLDAYIRNGLEDYEDQEEMNARLNTPGPSDDEIAEDEEYEQKGEQQQLWEEDEEYIEPWVRSPLSQKIKFRIARVDNWEGYNSKKAKWDEDTRVCEGKQINEPLDGTSWEENEYWCSKCDCCSGAWDDEGFDCRNNFDNYGRDWRGRGREGGGRGQEEGGGGNEDEDGEEWGSGWYKRCPALLVTFMTSEKGLEAARRYEEIVAQIKSEEKAMGKNVRRSETQGVKEDVELTIPDIKDLVDNGESCKWYTKHAGEVGGAACQQSWSAKRVDGTVGQAADDHAVEDGLFRDML